MMPFTLSQEPVARNRFLTAIDPRTMCFG